MPDTPCNIRLRALEPSDLEVLYIWENDPDVWRVSGTLSPISRERLAHFIEEQSYDIYATRQMRLVIECNKDGVAVGAVDLFEFDPQNRRAGIGIIVAPPYRRQGFAADALLCIERYAREVLHLHQLWCSVTADNEASLALFNAAGYMACGCRKEWILTSQGAIDEVMMQKLL
jgi:diamine N-acetyltransferase